MQGETQLEALEVPRWGVWILSQSQGKQSDNLKSESALIRPADFEGDFGSRHELEEKNSKIIPSKSPSDESGIFVQKVFEAIKLPVNWNDVFSISLASQ